jgi:lipoprotein-anchoring transpeptidase ErfK/SrfK
VADLFEAQVALARRGISAGSIDGAFGAQTRAALRAFQFQQRLEPAGRLDAATRAALTLDVEPYTRFAVTQADLDRLHAVPPTWLAKSEEARLDFESILELVAEESHAHPLLIRRLNPDVDWSAVKVGTTLRVPNAQGPPPGNRAALIRISLAGKTLEAFDEQGELLAHFPVSIAQRVEKRPVGDLFVEVTVKDPDYTFNPEVFPESAEARELGQKLKIPAGPNNPVGVAWIGLSLAGYGIHGTPKPEDVGHTESHGCFRLANWDAEYLRQMVRVGTRVRVEL